MNRRTFLLLTSGALIPGRAGSSSPRRSKRRILLVSVDGLDPEYLRRSDVPNLRMMMASGAYVEGKDVIPSVTNVNNASIVTASLPKDHGITSNYYYDRAAGKEHYMESAEYLLRPTIFERARTFGLRSAFVSSKDKLITLLSRGADVAVSAEKPGREFLDKAGPPPDIYSPEANYWSFRAARWLLQDGGTDLLYLATTDYMMHTYPPEDERSLEHMHTMDRLLGEILNEHPNLELYLTADHGMSAKTEAVDISKLLNSRGIAAEAVPIIKDRHVVHHQNLGGACYVYLKQRKDFPKAFAMLRETPGVEEIYDHRKAAELFSLHPDRIGDIFLLGRKQVAFGTLERIREDVRIRSHGSRHESAVPILCYGRKVDARKYRMNLDITRHLAWES